MPDLANTFQVVVADVVRAKKVDAVYNRLPLLAFWLASNQTVKDKMGQYFHVPIQVSPGPSGQWLATGWEPIQGQRVDNVRTMRFQLSTIATALDFPRRELIHATNQRSEALGDLIASQVQPALQQMRDDLATAIFQGAGVSTFESLDTGVNNTGTYGLLSRATYPALNSAVFPNAGALTITALKTWLNAINQLGVSVNLIVTTPTLYQALDNLIENKRTLYTTTNTVETQYGQLGFAGILINGTTTVLQDAKCQSGRVYGLYTPVWELAFGSGGDFAVTPFLHSYDQLVWRSFIVTDVLFYTTNPRLNFRATEVTAS